MNVVMSKCQTRFRHGHSSNTWWKWCQTHFCCVLFFFLDLDMLWTQPKQLDASQNTQPNLLDRDTFDIFFLHNFKNLIKRLHNKNSFLKSINSITHNKIESFTKLITSLNRMLLTRAFTLKNIFSQSQFIKNLCVQR